MKSKEDEGDQTGANQSWWESFAKKRGEEKMMGVSNGPKVAVFLHILTHAVQIGDKTIVFSQCLRTLDYIEKVLQLECWADQVKSLREEFPGTKLGGWVKGKDYLRIDGQTDSGKRGEMVDRFNKEGTCSDGGPNLFLISTKAGGIGITLTAANRVVLFDTHFNPVIANQALFRCYRFGQEKAVFAYRLLAEGTGEEKIYSRAVNKSGLSMRVVDGMDFKVSNNEVVWRSMATQLLRI